MLTRKAAAVAALVLACAVVGGCSDASDSIAPGQIWVTAAGHLTTGEEIYFGADHKDYGTIVGANPHIDTTGTGHIIDGVLLRSKKNGFASWKVRTFIDGGKWFVRTDDPHFNSGSLRLISHAEAEALGSTADSPAFQRMVAKALAASAKESGAKASKDDLKQMTETEIACQPLSAIEGIVKAVHDHNKKLATMMLQYGIGSHHCEKFYAGTPVHLENMTADGFAEIRRQHDAKTFWTPAEFVSQ